MRQNRGIIALISAKEEKILVNFDGTLVKYAKAKFGRTKHCFAVTIHKNQGQEYPAVILLVTGYHSTMLMRNLRYTGVTREMQKVILVGDRNTLMYVIQNVQETKRNTVHFDRLKIE